MIARAKIYRDRAEELRHRAADMITPGFRDELLEIAAQYDELAQELERVKKLED